MAQLISYRLLVVDEHISFFHVESTTTTKLFLSGDNMHMHILILNCLESAQKSQRFGSHCCRLLQKAELWRKRRRSGQWSSEGSPALKKDRGKAR